MNWSSWCSIHTTHNVSDSERLKSANADYHQGGGRKWTVWQRECSGWRLWQFCLHCYQLTWRWIQSGGYCLFSVRCNGDRGGFHRVLLDFHQLYRPPIPPLPIAPDRQQTTDLTPPTPEESLIVENPWPTLICKTTQYFFLSIDLEKGREYWEIIWLSNQLFHFQHDPK